MRNYAKGKPVGNNLIPFYDSPPAEVALSRSVRDNASASSILVVSDDTTAIEVAATNGAAFIKWLQQSVVDSSVAGTSIVSAASGANFDNVVPANTVRRFVIPIAKTVQTTSIQGINPTNGLYKNVAIKTAGIASVAAIEF